MTGSAVHGDLHARLGYGLAAVGRPAYITAGRAQDLGEAGRRSVAMMRDHAFTMLDAAWNVGIRYFDMARSYGRAEQFVGLWLTEHPDRRHQLTLGSKWGYEYVGGWRLDTPVHERKEHSLSMLERQWPETLSALGSAPDIYLVHSVTPESPVLQDRSIVDRLRAIADGGVRIGFSTSGADQAGVIDAALALDDSPFSAVQATWNLLEQSAAPALERADAAGWLIVVKEALANGRLTTRGDEGAAAALAAENGQSVDAFAIGAAASHGWADFVLSGAVTPAQLRENVAAAIPDLSDQRIAALAEPPERYWADRAARAWE